MNTLEQFKKDMDWSMTGYSDEFIEQIYNSVDVESYKDIEEFEEDFPHEDFLTTWDENLVSVIEDFYNSISRGLFKYIQLYYLEESDVYAGVLVYDDGNY